MYDYIATEIKNGRITNVPENQRYWFEQAALINQYINNPSAGTDNASAIFIENANILSLGSRYSVSLNREITNDIAFNVGSDILKFGGITSLLS